MAYYDYAAAELKRKEQEAYDKFMEESCDKEEYVHLRMFLIGREEKLKEQEEKLKTYEKFFETLSSLLPRRFTTSTVIR